MAVGAESEQKSSPRSGSAAGSKRGSERAGSRRGSNRGSSIAGSERRRDGPDDELSNALAEAAAAGFFSLLAFAWKLLREADGNLGRKVWVLCALLLDVLWQADILLPVEALCCTFYFFSNPSSVAFFGGDVNCLVHMDDPGCDLEAKKVRNNAKVFIASYMFDTIFLSCSLARIQRALPPKYKLSWQRICGGKKGDKHSSAVAGWQAPSDDSSVCSMTAVKTTLRPVLQMIIVVPWDAFLWSTAYVQWVPFVRMMRLLPFGFQKIDTLLTRIERSQNISFIITRSARIAFISFWVVHIFACLFYFGANQATIQSHYESAPWMRGVNSSDPESANAYLRALYWGLISVTTVGHVDVMDEDPSRPPAADWELWISIFIVVLATFVYIYLTANFTSMTMRSYQQLEKYRTYVAHVESYLQRHHVRPTLRRLVRQHVKQQFELDGRDDEAILRELPRSMRRELMIDINMRTLRTASLFVGSNNAMISLVCSMLTRVSFLREELIHKQGDVRCPPRQMNPAPSPAGSYAL